MKQIRVVKSGFLLLIPLVVSACGSGSSSKEPELGPVTTVQSSAEVVLPLDAYQLSQKEYLNIQRASWRLTGKCVARFGGSYTLPEVAVLGNVPQFEHMNERRYGLLDAASAANNGYNLPADQLPPATGRAFAWNPSDAELLLLNGATAGSAVAVPTDGAGAALPAGGCRGEATRQLSDSSGSQPPDENLAATLAVESFKRSQADSRVKAVVAKWAACMKAGGRNYREVFEPNDFNWPDPAGQEEIATAQADVACKKQVNLAGVWLAVESAYQKAVMDDHVEELRALQAYVRAQAANAARVVNGGG